MAGLRNIIGQTPFNAPLVELATVGSTNNYAAEMLKTGEVAHGTVILAEEQTAGKGQRDRLWISQKGKDLTFSLVLKPTGATVGDQISFSHMTALTLRDLLESEGAEEVKVKWPNDVLVGQDKISGVLIENSMIGDSLEYLIIGVGLNVGTKMFPESIKATSMELALNKEFEPRALLDSFLFRFQAKLKNWEEAGRDYVSLDDSLWNRGIWSDFVLDGQEVLAKPLTVNEKGRMVAEMKDGSIRSFGTERLRHIRV